MAQFRPAGFSDEDSDSDDYGFYEKPKRYIPAAQQHNTKKKLEIRLQDAIINGNIDEVERIISHDLNSNANLKLDSGWTPLMHACFHTEENIVKLLLDLGADPNLHADSVTPLMAVCSNSSAEDEAIQNIVTRLIEKDCILNVGDKYGQTPLMRAIGSGRAAAVQTLLDGGANIEMRDRQGWTAVFWAAHHNQPEILETLIARGARLGEVDKLNRTVTDIAYLHDYDNIVEILNRYLKPDDQSDNVENNASQDIDNNMASWHDYYPGLTETEHVNYTNEISNLLYGMKCERLAPLFQKSGIDLRKFLLLDDDQMKEIGIEMPYERQRLRQGLRDFHLRGWKLNAVSGLHAKKDDNYSVLDGVTTLGSHLQQVYVLETTLQYAMREYKTIEHRLKFEPPDSPLTNRLTAAAQTMAVNIKSITKELINLRTVLLQVSKKNPKPADLIKEKSGRDIAFGFFSEVVVFGTLVHLVYHIKSFITDLYK